MKIISPDKTTYADRVKTLQGLLKSVIPDISNSVGSTLFEFVIRPMAIAYAYLEDRINTVIKTHTLSYFESSSNTEMGDADRILSNYFITRKSGSEASALITIYSNSELTKIPTGSSFVANGVSLSTIETVYGVYPDTSGYVSDERTSYVAAYKVGDTYCFNIQVSTTYNTSNVLPAGINVEPSVYIPGVVKATLCSALEGGSEQETDAQMVARARSSVCSWNGGSASIDKILKTSGLPVLSSASFGPGDAEFLRVVDSPVFIGTQGMVDTYVRTCTYPLSGSIVLSSDDLDTAHIALPAGVISIDSVIGDSGTVYTYDTVWGSSSPTLSDVGARLSVYQTIKIIVDNLKDSLLEIRYTYIPYIKELQEYIQRPDVKLIGVDIIVKAAIPSIVTIRGSVELGGNDISDIRSTIKEYINSKQVGDYTLNISHMNNYINTNYSGSYLISPISMQAASTDITGNKSVSTSVSGLLTNSTEEHITRRMKFFCISDMGVLVE